jgi:rod shape determining protein RodA
MRILIWLEPENYPSEAWQVINGQNAVGRGGLTGRGIASAGSLASLGFVSDDHTDFIFSICCESFGLVGASILVILYMLMLGRLIYWVIKVDDPLGSFILVGVISMFLFHVIENIGMVIGLLPVTGIPLPFMSYGGSNMLTCMMAMGLAFNVIMRYRFRQHRRMLRTEIEI